MKQQYEIGIEEIGAWVDKIRTQDGMNSVRKIRTT